MSQDNNTDQTIARAEALRRHQATRTAAEPTDNGKGDAEAKPQGLIPILTAWKNAVMDVVKRKTRWLKPLLRPFIWAIPKLAKGTANAARKHWNFIAYKKDEKGNPHFSGKRLARYLALDAAVIFALPFAVAGSYYHATLHEYNQLFIPNAGVFVNQQFAHPSAPGKIIAPRDEIFTVLGQRDDGRGHIESMRFDVDSNFYFFYKPDALRPDLLSAKMVPISPFGAMCDVQATGIYTRLPRILRANVVKWLDLRSEIVEVKSCVQLESMPKEYARGNAPVIQMPTHPHRKVAVAFPGVVAN